MENTTLIIEKKPVNKISLVVGIALLAMALICFGYYALCIYASSSIGNDPSSHANLAAGVAAISLWFYASALGFIGSVLLCLSLMFLVNIRRPSKNVFTDGDSLRKYYRKVSTLGLVWLLVCFVAVLMFVFTLASAPGQYLLITEPAYLVLVVFGLVNAIRYSAWAKIAKSTITRLDVPSQTPLN